jgi:DNA-binding transcriptional regulator YiaG
MNNNKGQGKCVKWVRDHVNYAHDYCLIWPFNKVGGYGTFGYNGKMYYAHRMMCELVHGSAPSDKHHAAHSCGKGHKGCVNPKHICWKTISENQRDRRLHGTHKGGKGSRTKLTSDEIAELRSMRNVCTQQQLADRFGVKRGCIQYWLRSDHPPVPPGNSQTARWRRSRKQTQFSSR